MRSTFLSLSLSSLATVSAVLPHSDGSQQSLIVNKPLVSSEAIQSHVSSKRLLRHAEHLFELAKLSVEEYAHPTRVIGSLGHWATIDYIYSTVTSLGSYYHVSNQSFPAVVGNIFEYRLVLGDVVPTSASAMSLTPSTENKEPVYGPLVLVSNDGCGISDYPSNVTGSIALIRRGTCSFGTKSENAGLSGAIAAVVYNNVKGNISGTLGEPSTYHVATFGISDTDAEPFIKDLKDGKRIDSSAYIDATVETINTTNVIAQTRDGDPENCVMLGGHSDSVAEGPGINDDGSGTLTLLEVATLLTKFRVRNCVRFAWWAAEEEGLLGSDFYVSQLSDEENLKIRLFMDYDMLASPNYAYQVYNATDALSPAGSQALRDLYTDYYTSQGRNYTYVPFDGRSDYDAFIQNGIPGGGVATGAEGIKTEQEVDMFGGTAGEWYDHCYHQLCDDVGNLDLDAWQLNTKLIAHSVATYARSLDGFPERTLVKPNAVRKPSLYHGHKLVM